MFAYEDIAPLFRQRPYRSVRTGMQWAWREDEELDIESDAEVARGRNAVKYANDPGNMSLAEMREVDHIVIPACGTSWHAALLGEYLLEEFAHIPTEVEYASEFRYRNAPLEKHTLHSNTATNRAA